MPKRKNVSTRVWNQLFKEAGGRCPLCSEDDIDTLEVHHIQPVAEGGGDGVANLILVCANCHACIEAGGIGEAVVRHQKQSLVAASPRKSRGGDQSVSIRGDVTGSVVGNTVNIRGGSRTVKIGPPAGTIASDRDKRNYVKRLIDRYHDFKRADDEVEKMNYALIYNAIKREFKCKWDFIPIDRFDELVAYLQRRIDDTKQGRNQKAQGCKRYTTFEEFMQQQGGRANDGTGVRSTVENDPDQGPSGRPRLKLV